MAQTHSLSPSSTDTEHEPTHGKFWALFIGSIGVVYGDIGTSPLYAFKEAINTAREHGSGGPDAVIGILSLIVWTLLLIVTLKYVLILLHADNRGEGGIFALMALGQSKAKRSASMMTMLAIAGAAFFYGDAVITPAISVLSAVEGLKVIAPQTERLVLPITVLILFGLFAMQSRGTGAVAKYFGPITAVWFVAMGVGGLLHLFDDARILLAFSPYYGLKFVFTHGLLGFTVMGLVFLAVTGAEALYADLGHFGRKPIQAAWLFLILPCLLFNYFGQAALILADPSVIDNPFLKLYPRWAQLPMVLLSTVATVIASQAVITGAFSLTRQAVALGLLPRHRIVHTSETVAGQIYLPRVNWLLCAGVIVVTVLFQSSSRLAAAYGISVTAAMVIDSFLAFFVIWRCWNWPLWKAAGLIVPLVLIEQTFFAANFLKLFDGGWVPLALASLIMLSMLTWQKGSRALAKATRRDEQELAWFARKIESQIEKKRVHRAPGTAIFLTGDPQSAPTSLMHNLKHNKVIHERNIILSIQTLEQPRVARHDRIHVEEIEHGFWRVIARYGFMESPSVPKIIEQCKRKNLNIDIGGTSFFLSRRSLRPTDKSEMPWWQEWIFIWMAGNAADATEFFRIPHDRVVEVGTQVLV